MVHTIVWRVGSGDTLDFWEQRLQGEAQSIERTDGRLASSRIPRVSGTSCR